jgi:hypothetical protein
MEKVTQVLNWAFLAVCGASLFLSASRGPNPAPLVFAVPFAATLAVLYFPSKLWFVVLAVAANALVVVSFGYFALSALFTGLSIGSSPAVLWAFFITLVLVCALNTVMVLVHFRRATQLRVPG